MNPDILRTRVRDKVYPCSNLNYRSWWEGLEMMGHDICLDAMNYVQDGVSGAIPKSAAPFWPLVVETMSKCKCLMILIGQIEEWPNQRCMIELGIAMGQGIPIYLFCPFFQALPNPGMVLGGWLSSPEVICSDNLAKTLQFCSNIRG